MKKNFFHKTCRILSLPDPRSEFMDRSKSPLSLFSPPPLFFASQPQKGGGIPLRERGEEDFSFRLSSLFGREKEEEEDGGEGKGGGRGTLHQKRD